jgi:hypothetical protein
MDFFYLSYVPGLFLAVPYLGDSPWIIIGEVAVCLSAAWIALLSAKELALCDRVVDTGAGAEAKLHQLSQGRTCCDNSCCNSGLS